MLKQGEKAFNFRLKDENGKEVSLSEFAGKKVVIYFYPKDETPGCIKEACAIRDTYDDILEKGAVVIGISPDNAASHAKFKKKHQLPFYLLCDEDHSVAEQYGAWGEKKMCGKTYMGIIRSTFIVDENGLISKVYPAVRPESHGKEILMDL